MRRIALLVVAIITAALSLPATADSKQIGKIKLLHYVIAADPQLHPGECVRRNGSGPDVRVGIPHEDEVALVPATLVTNKSDLETGAKAPSNEKMLWLFKCSHVLRPRMDEQSFSRQCSLRRSE
jgi:hypothetical protein